TGTENILSNGGSFESLDENNVDAVIFSKDDLSFNGEGSLRIKSPAGNGVCSKDDLVFTGGTYTVTAEGHALEANDSVRICAGTFTLDAGKDGVHCENDAAEPGFVYISDGSFDILSGGDAISADGCVQIDGGTFDLNCGGGSGTVTLSGDEFKWSRPDAAQQTQNDDKASAKGIKSGMSIAVNAGEIVIDSADDSLHAAESLYVSGGTLTLSSGDDALHADEKLCISGGSLDILKSYEGIEGLEVYISGGDISVVSSDDGINAAGGRDRSGSGGYRGFSGNGAFEGSADSLISISGGTVHVNANGDGLDSNGSVTVSDGDIFIDGPTDSGNSALDYELSAEITGGILVAVGSAGMAQNFGTAAQGAMLLSTGEQEAGSTVTVADGKGNVILRYVPEKKYSSVVLSSADIRQGETYTVTAGTYSAEITMDSLIYSAGGASGMGIRPDGGKHDAPGEKPAAPDGDDQMPPGGEKPMRSGERPMKS
ncbi:MAG: carbohydrate-binding domain-containing protein, partial [Candidatus Avispirillum sp.]